MIWRIIARWLACNPEVIRWIKRSAMERPYFNLPGYMDRWWLLPGAAADDPKSQYRPPRWLAWLPVSIRLHYIRRPDNDRHLHDHPCDFRSIILKGYYAERRRRLIAVHDYGAGEREYDEITIWRTAGSTYFAKATDFHSITAMPAAGVWTLFIMYQTPGPGWNRWGFLVDGKKIPWREYLKEKENE